MKKTDVTYQDKLNELKLDLSHPNSEGINFIFVEGESDIRLFRKFFNLEKCKVEEIPGGNIDLERVVSCLLKKDSLIIGIRDADFIHLSNKSYSRRNMFLTDFHDIETTMLVQESVLNPLVFEFAEYTKERHLEFRNNIIKSIEKVSYLKWLNDKEDLRFNFSNVGFQDLISFKSFDIDFTLYLKRVISKSENIKIKNVKEINIKVKNLMKLKPDLMQLTNGHDLLNVFAKFFREEKKHKNLSDKNIASALRLIFTFEHFKTTKLYENLTKWEKRNKTELFINTL